MLDLRLLVLVPCEIVSLDVCKIMGYMDVMLNQIMRALVWKMNQPARTEEDKAQQ